MKSLFRDSGIDAARWTPPWMSTVLLAVSEARPSTMQLKLTYVREGVW
jgi:hypothetical protein